MSHRNDTNATYDRTLLASVPDPTRAEKQEGYNVDLLDEGRDRRAPSPPAPDRQNTDQQPLTAGYSPGAAALARKEGQVENGAGPTSAKGRWYRTRWGITAIVIIIVLIIGAIVGGVVGGTHHSSSKSSDRNSTTGNGNSTTGGGGSGGGGGGTIIGSNSSTSTSESSAGSIAGFSPTSSSPTSSSPTNFSPTTSSPISSSTTSSVNRDGTRQIPNPSNQQGTQAVQSAVDGVS